MNQISISRRRLLKLLGGGILVTTLGGYEILRRVDSLDYQNIVRPKMLGTTFSQLQCKYLELDYKEVFLAIKSLGLDVIRLCTYWDEIESREGIFDFSVIDWIVEKAQDAGWQIVLSIGMKTPRWPEFHFPRWIEMKYDVTRTNIPIDNVAGLSEEALIYTHEVVQHMRQYSKIKYWQVENESLNLAPVAGGRYLSASFVQKEIKAVKESINPDQKILFTFGVDPPFAIQNAEQIIGHLLPFVDAVGFDIYVKVPTGVNVIEYAEALPPFWQNIRRWKDFVSQNQKEVWIAESQAEPWERDKLVAIGNRSYPSSDPDRAVKLASRLSTLGFNPVLFWGCEHWYWHKKQGHNEWWDTMSKYIRSDK